VVPGFLRLKEWAYAGIVFDLSSAIASHAACGNWGDSIAPLSLLCLAIASWALTSAVMEGGMMLRTRLCELLEIEAPVLGAPMGPDIAGLDLAAAVSNAGGLGMISWGGYPCFARRLDVYPGV
jgi:hypothetical protein